MHCFRKQVNTNITTKYFFAVLHNSVFMMFICCKANHITGTTHHRDKYFPLHFNKCSPYIKLLQTQLRYLSSHMHTCTHTHITACKISSCNEPISLQKIDKSDFSTI